NLERGNYSVTVHDNNACALSQSITLTEPFPIILTEIHTDANCYGSNDASINLNITGGTGPYTFHWNSGATSEDLLNASAGIYSVTVNDIHSCPASVSVIITEPPGMLLNTSFINPTCASNPDDGSISLTVSGGLPPYQYHWSNGSAASDLFNIGPGDYSVTVT